MEKEQIGLDPDVVQDLVSEDIVSPMDLVEFKKEKIEMLASNLRKTKGNRMVHPDQAQDDQG